MKSIKVYGPGCAKCKRLERLVLDTVKKLGVDADVEKITDYQAIAAAGILGTPALKVDDVLKVSGRLPKVSELEAWLA